ncbi:MAG TPA: lysylphosphatidylglycerol synthase domain-containing protein [Gemmatimonadales bacterium]
MRPTVTQSSRTIWLLQGVLALAVIVFVWRSAARHWDEFRSLEFAVQLRPGWIALAGAVVLVTYGLLVAAWRAVIGGWGERLAYRPAVRIWTVSNLGRYLPGKVWSVAGLAVLAQREGVAAWAAVGAAVAMQAIAVGSGVAVAAATVPGTLSAPGALVAAAVAAATIAALAMPRVVALVGRITRRPGLRPMPVRAVVLAGTVTTVSWLAYGVGFWCLARGTLGNTSLGMAPAIGVFAAGYITGLLALFAPGGVGVREAVFIALLAPSVGSGGAIVLGVASRALLTLTEVAAALLGLLGGRGGPAVGTGPAVPGAD